MGLWRTPGWEGTSGLGGTGSEELENTRLGELAGQRGELGTPDWTRHQTGGREDTGLRQPKFHRSGDTGMRGVLGKRGDSGGGKRSDTGLAGRGITHDPGDTEPAWFRINHIEVGTVIRSPPRGRRGRGHA